MNTERITNLITKAQKGDIDARNQLVSETYNEIYFYVLKTVKDENVAMDVTQDTFLEIMSTLNSLREPKAFPLWARRIAYHKSALHFRKNKEVFVEENEDGETIFDQLPDESEGALPEQVAEDKEFRGTIMGMINNLSPEQRSALLLYYYEKMSVKDIAEIQDTTENTVKSRLSYARKAIKGKVEEYEERTGTKLHSIAIIPLLLRFVFGSEKSAMPALSVPATVTTAAGASAAGASAAGASAAGASAATAVGATAAKAGIPLAAKIAAGVVAASLTIGGGAFGVSKLFGNDNKNSNHGDDSSYIEESGSFNQESGSFNQESGSNSQVNGGGSQGDDLVSQGLKYVYVDSYEEPCYFVSGIGTYESKKLVIPAEYEGLPVLGTYENAFKNSDITEVVIPDDFIVGESAFENCDALEKVTLGKNCVVSLSAFRNCDSLCEVVFPNGDFELGNYCFADCPSLTFLDLDILYFEENQTVKTFVIDKNNNIISEFKAEPTAFKGTNIKLNSCSFNEGFFETSYVQFDEILCNSYKTINLPQNVKPSLYSFCNATCNINYNGTIAQWNQIEWSTKNRLCSENINATPITINCTDGTVNAYSSHPHRAVDSDMCCVDCGKQFNKDLSYYIEYEIINQGTEAYISDITLEVEELTVPSAFNGLPVYKICDTPIYDNIYIKTLKLEEGFKYIADLQFLSNLEAIYLPSTMETIDCDTFSYSIKDIYYNGTISDWNNMDVDPDFAYLSSPITVHCTDGDIVIEE